MRASLNKVLAGVLAFLVVWSASTWFIGKNTKQYFGIALEAIANSKASSFFEVEVLSHDESFFGSIAEIKLIPVSALLDESLERQQFTLHRNNGPVFINRDGIQFGLVRWEVSMREIAPDATSNSEKPLGTAIINFSEAMKLNFSTPTLTVSKWVFEKLGFSGVLDFAKREYDFETNVSRLSYSHQQFTLSLDEVDFESSSVSTGQSSKTDQTLTQLALTTQQSELSLRGQQKKTKFNLQSNGSLWANNDTLSGDLQLNSNSEESKKPDVATDALGSDALVLDAQLQFRELLTDGFWQVLNKQSEIFSLLQQADWAMEDIETPEQQDFLRSLYLDAARITRTQLQNPLRPLLIAEQSKMAIKTSLSNASNGSLSQLSLGGTAGFETNSPKLVLKGLVKVDSKMLNSPTLALLDKWSKRRWFRQYEAEFEADLLIRNQKFLLNNFLVPVDAVKDELSNALADQ